MLWWRDGIIYQIYPRSFADSNGDGIGDLQGIISHLDYLSDLGVDALWLSPFFPSPDVDFGYDVSDYTGVDPKFGTMADFDRLLAETHRRGMKMMLDLVMNHTSDQHPWFQESRKSKDNPYRNWYIWRPPSAKGSYPNNWQSIMGGPAWELDPATGEYYLHLFFKQQPDLNWHNPAVRKAMLDVYRFWLEKGVDGFRLDVFNLYFKHRDLPDNPRLFSLSPRGFDRQKHRYDLDQPKMMPLLNEIRALVDSYPDRYLVGETFDASLTSKDGPEKAAAYIGPKRLHASFNFDFMGGELRIFGDGWNAARFKKSIQRWEHALGKKWPNYVLNNHDVTRSASRLAHGENDDRLKVAAALLLTLRGTPFLYYGEEIGMRNIPIRAKEDVLDPIGKTFWPFIKGRDGCRSPMQWDATPNAGFSLPSAVPWLPLHQDYPVRNVAAQQESPHSLLNFYRKLIALRKVTPALIEGKLIVLPHTTRQMLVYLRLMKDQTVLVALNFSGRSQRLKLDGGLVQLAFRLLLSSHRSQIPEQGAPIILDPNEALILEVAPRPWHPLPHPPDVLA